MTMELLYTSAPEGLKRGSRGFATVLCTQGMPSNLTTRLEGLSAYRHIFPAKLEDSQNPIAFSHLRFVVGGQTYSVLSRVADYGVDYSHRTNKIAHHVVLTAAEYNSAGPAWSLLASGVMRNSWSGTCETPAAGPSLADSASPARKCSGWEKHAGDAGWGGLVAEAFTGRAKPTWIVFDPANSPPLLELIAESLALVPDDDRWAATFSTYTTKLPPDVECQVRCVAAGSEEARMAPARGQVIDLSMKLGGAPEQAWTQYARTGVSPFVSRATEHSQHAFQSAPSNPDRFTGNSTDKNSDSETHHRSPELGTSPPELPTRGRKQLGRVSTPKPATAIPAVPQAPELPSRSHDLSDEYTNDSAGSPPVPWIIAGAGSIACIALLGLVVLLLANPGSEKKSEQASVGEATDQPEKDAASEDSGPEVADAGDPQNTPDQYTPDQYTPEKSTQTRAPQTQAPQTQAPQTQAPQTQAPQTQVPQTQAPQTKAPQTQAPQTQAPQTQAPQTQAPQTQAPQTQAPQTQAPQTQAPQTQAPQTQAPQTQAPGQEDNDISLSLALPYDGRQSAKAGRMVAEGYLQFDSWDYKPINGEYHEEWKTKKFDTSEEGVHFSKKGEDLLVTISRDDPKIEEWKQSEAVLQDRTNKLQAARRRIINFNPRFVEKDFWKAHEKNSENLKNLYFQQNGIKYHDDFVKAYERFNKAKSRAEKASKDLEDYTFTCVAKLDLKNPGNEKRVSLMVDLKVESPNKVNLQKNNGTQTRSGVNPQFGVSEQ